MRLDLFLRRSGIVKHRSFAKEACDRDEVRVDGREARASKDVMPGSLIDIELPRESLRIRVKSLPLRNYKRSEGEAFYDVVERRGRELF
jgi:ribosomal 50S subunit-recycling heat shock protein